MDTLVEPRTRRNTGSPDLNDGGYLRELLRSSDNDTGKEEEPVYGQALLGQKALVPTRFGENLIRGVGVYDEKEGMIYSEDSLGFTTLGVTTQAGLAQNIKPSTFQMERITDWRSKISKLSEDHCEDNWDGEGAVALRETTMTAAQNLAELFPQALQIYDNFSLSATAFGEIDFDWQLPDKTEVTISVCPSGAIVITALLEEANLEEMDRSKRSNIQRFINCWCDMLNRLKANVW